MKLNRRAIRTRASRLLVGLAWLLCVGAAAAPPAAEWVLAQAATPQPPAVSLEAPRFDAGRKVYLLDLVYTHPEGIGVLQISLIDRRGVEVVRSSAAPQGYNQSVEVDAGQMQPGETYRVEVKGFAPNNAPLLNNGSSLLAERQFVHQPGPPGLGDLRFQVDPVTAWLSIEVPAAGSWAVTGYRVVLEDQETQAVALDERLPAGLPLTVSLAAVPPGEYQVSVLALDAAGSVLAQAQDKLRLQQGALALGSPLFTYRDAPPALVVQLQSGQSGDPAAPPPAVAGYRVLLIEPAANRIAREAHPPAGAEIAVPLDGLPGGEYRVVVQALDAAGAVLAEASGETLYTPPAPPPALARLWSGLLANPLIPLLIGLLVLLGGGGLLLALFRERRATATPVLQGWGRSGGAPDGLPLSHTALHDPHGTLENPDPAVRPPELLLAVLASPDRAQVGKTYRLARYPFSIGRQDADLCLPGDEHLSRRHAELQFRDGRLYIVDRLSSNGTYVNGERIPADQPVGLSLARPVQIRLGRDTQLQLSVDGRRPSAGPGG
ncbi:MAG: FHA domain-containing protein [Chloroflexota bacterium]